VEDSHYKRSKNFDERPHRHLVTPRGGKWIRPTFIIIIIYDKIRVTPSQETTASAHCTIKFKKKQNYE